MWKVVQEREERQAKEGKKVEAPIDLLTIRAVEGDKYRSELDILVPSKDIGTGPGGAAFKDSRVRGPKRINRAEAVKDGLELRSAFRSNAVTGGGEAGVRRRQLELQSKYWRPEELPGEHASVEEPGDDETRRRLASRPRGTGWSRQGDTDFFVHTHAPMGFSQKKMEYFLRDPVSQKYVTCEPPHDPEEHPISVNASSSSAGASDEDLSDADRPRTLLLKELVKTGAAMKHPLFFLDQPAACFALFDGLRSGAAVDICSKHFHTKLLPRLSGSIQFWSDAALRELFTTIFAELDAQLLDHGSVACYAGASVGVALLLGDRLAVATVGAVRGLLIPPVGVGEALCFGSCHLLTDGSERQRVESAGGEVLESLSSCALLVRRPVRIREVGHTDDPEAEIARVLERAPDSFAVLGFGLDDPVDAKTARTLYKKLALKVHPDKAPPSLQMRAKEAFAKVEAAVAALEKICEFAEAANAMPSALVLHRVLRSAGSVTRPVMPHSWAYAVLDMEGTVTFDDVEKQASELRAEFAKLGAHTDGSLAHADTISAERLLQEAVEVLAAPPIDEAEGVEALNGVKVTRALGLRDLKKPHQILLGEPHVDVVQLEGLGAHHLALLSSGSGVLSDEELVSRIRLFARQPKAASFTVAQDAARRCFEQGIQGPSRIASCVVGVLEVRPEGTQMTDAVSDEPVAKKARTDKAAVKDRVRCRHILLKHKDLKLKIDKEAHLRQRGPVSRSVAEAERELMRIKQVLAKDPSQFHLMARKHSECQSALQPGQMAGDLGWAVRGGSIDAEFERVMFSLEVHEMSDLINTPRGIHIVHRIA